MGYLNTLGPMRCGGSLWGAAVWPCCGLPGAGAGGPRAAFKAVTLQLLVQEGHADGETLALGALKQCLLQRYPHFTFLPS